MSRITNDSSVRLFYELTFLCCARLQSWIRRIMSLSSFGIAPERAYSSTFFSCYHVVSVLHFITYSICLFNFNFYFVTYSLGMIFCKLESPHLNTTKQFGFCVWNLQPEIPYWWGKRALNLNSSADFSSSIVCRAWEKCGKSKNRI